jgi:hypothetical protein
MYPLPSVVLRVEEEVGGDDRDTDGHDDEDDVHQQHEAVHVVVPDGRVSRKHSERYRETDRESKEARTCSARRR